MTQTLFDPEIWLETTVRGIKDYVQAALDPNVYDVVMEFPGAALDENNSMPMRKTIVHFEIDDIVDSPVSMGDEPMELNYDATAHTIDPQWAAMHVINFDVGVWASDASGGTTSRMRVRQILFDLFGRPHGITKLRQATDGGDGAIEILKYSGGAFTVDSISDVRVFRMINGELEVRVFSRTKRTNEIAPAIEEIDQAPGLTIL
jgi:hypothetical protein